MSGGNHTKPNVLLIIADGAFGGISGLMEADLGYSDVGCFGAEIATPNIDRLANEGLLYTDFHSAAACSPTRAMLLSGTDSHLSGLGVMAEARSAAPATWFQPGHEGYLNFDVAALSELLQDGGYHTLLSGKWHLGFKPECGPHNRGFDKSLALLPGQTNHWAFHPELDLPNDFFARMPILHTYQGERKIFYDEGFYSTNYYTDKLIDFIEERSPLEAEKPFFAMLPFAAPHWPLQCSKEDRDKYKGVYDDGPAALRERRLKRMKEIGIIGQDVIAHEMIDESYPGTKYRQWEEMTSEERKKSARAMETYAGMVDCIDRNVGKIVDYLETKGLKDSECRVGEWKTEAIDTLIAFMSDNGSEGAAIEAWPTLGKDILRIARLFFNNKYENIGNHDSFVWYGPRWAQASTAPSKLYKGYSTEGGIRVPLVIRYPKWGSGRVIRSFGTVMDLAPTILDMAGLPHPVPIGQVKGLYKGREIFGMRGTSWNSALSDTSRRDTENDMLHGLEKPMGWEMHGRAAMRRGKWKVDILRFARLTLQIVYLSVYSFGHDRWELYDLSVDPGERVDLSEQYPEIFQGLLSEWDTYVKETQTIWPNPTSTGYGFGAVPDNTLGGDPVEQCTAWMDVGEGEVARLTLPHYGDAGKSSLDITPSVDSDNGDINGDGNIKDISARLAQKVNEWMPKMNGLPAVHVNGAD